jgi:chromate transporter
MNKDNDLWDIAAVFSLMSVIAVGGINSVLPELQRLTVDVHHWATVEEFIKLYAISQASPGPNLMVTTLIGWHVGGILGAAVATVCVVGPSSVITYFVSRTWTHFREARWRKAIQAGMIPVAVGMIAAGAFIIADSVAAGRWQPVVVTLVTATAVVFTRIHPLIPLVLAAVVGYFGFV